MRLSPLKLTATLLVSSLAVGCQNKMADENKALWAQNQELQARNNELAMQLRAAPTAADLQAAQGEIARRDAQIAQLEADLRRPTPAGPPAADLAGIDATYDERAGTLTVNVPGSVLFDPGRATIKPSARGTLDKIVGAIQKSYPGKQVFVDGHTDPDPISRTKNLYDDNFELGFERAHAVAKYLTGKGINEKKIAIRTFGPNKPKGTKNASRRVEIVVLTR